MTATHPGAPGSSSHDNGAAFPALRQHPNLPPRVQRLLGGLLQLLGAHFEDALRDTLDEIEQALSVRGNPPSSGASGRFADLRELSHHRPNIALRFLQVVESSFASIRDDAQAAATSGLTPDLGDVIARAEDLTPQEIAGKAEIEHRYALDALAHRFGVLAGSPIWSNADLPLGPTQLIAAFRHALQPLAFGVEQRVLAYRQFERIAIVSIGALYERANAYLIAQRVLPTLDLLSGPRTKISESAAPAMTASASIVRPLAAGATPAPPPATVDDAALPAMLRGVLAERRRSNAERAQAATASAEELQAVLAGMQRRSLPSARFDSEHFRNTLLVKLRRVNADGVAPDLANAEADTVDLVGMLFNYLTRNMREGGIGRELLIRLHVPVLRIALIDENFFTQRAHSARELLNVVAEAGARWADDSDLDTDLLRQLQIGIDSIANACDGDRAQLDIALADLGRHLQLLARRAETAERRHVDAARGRDKLGLAREQARLAVARVLQRGSASAVVRSLLEQPWTDALALSALRGGPEGAEFRRRVAVADHIVQCNGLTRSPMPLDPTLRSDLDAGLRQVGVHDDDIREVLRCLLPTSGEPATDARTIEDALQRKTRLGAGSLASTTTDPVIELGATEAATLDELRRTPLSTWFDFTMDTHAVRRKLAWFSPSSGHCVFVNQRGVPSETDSLQKLARHIVRGRARRVVDGHLSLIDRAWRAIAETLRAHPSVRAGITPAAPRVALDEDRAR